MNARSPFGASLFLLTLAAGTAAVALAQDIFRDAFNHAFSAHADEPDQDERAFRIAWAAVKRSYEKVGDEWVRR